MKKYGYLAFIFLLLGCGSSTGKEIAKLPEASGIGYCENTGTFIVANDEGSYYELSTKGKILQKVKLGKYDLEGVVCEDETLIFVREDKGLVLVNRKTGKKEKIHVNTMYKGKKYKLFDKKEGIEGIAKVGNLLYLSKQNKKKKHSFIAVVQMKPYPSRIVGIIEHDIMDVAGLSYHDGMLYMVSDKEDLLLQYNLKKKKIVKKVPLQEGAWEGIAFDSKAHVYLSDDNGWVIKYKKKRLGL